ncbi:DOMON domain-containing protein CG14681 [Papilio xuthus]|uniref:DOMON domain-containing protein CG14681 n=1 Tax=Papilio xuthus TaxID=66420 RepID=A0A194PKW4_PAPXU|nr:DOMON domain-containing protein CG14681 [Papilio xuthus]
MRSQRGKRALISSAFDFKVLAEVILYWVLSVRLFKASNFPESTFSRRYVNISPLESPVDAVLIHRLRNDRKLCCCRCSVAVECRAKCPALALPYIGSAPVSAGLCRSTVLPHYDLNIIRGVRARYLGKEIGALSRLQHGVRGALFAVDSRTLYLHDFHYDGAGPAAYFFVGTSKAPSSSGVRLRDERGGSSPLRAYRGEGLTLSLPEGQTLRDLRWFSVWCDEYAVNFGSVSIPSGLEYPRPARLGALRGVHGVRSEPVLAVDAQTLLVPNFSYDGEAPDAKFWVGRGETPSPQGIRIPDENGKEEPLRKYDNKTIVLTLPGELTVFDIGHFAVWCEAFTVDFGHIVLPRAALANVPPSLKMLGVSPQSRNKALAGPDRPASQSPPRPAAPLAPLRATTYRPVRLGAGPPLPLPARPAHRPHTRRADTYVASPQQLLDNPRPLNKDRHDHEVPTPKQLKHDENQNDERRNVHFDLANDQPQYREQSPEISNYQSAQREREQRPDRYRHLNRENQELLRQQELYEQQRRALEQQLLRQQEHYRLEQEPYRHRLLRQEWQDSPDFTVQRSLVLDPEATGPHPQ